MNISQLNKSKVSHDDPPFSTALCAITANSSAFFLTSFPTSPSINSFTILLTSSLFTIPFNDPSQLLTLTPTLISSATIFAFIGCSAIIGKPRIGTPALKLSTTEFQPQ
ncbi:hypothetical protein G4B88_015540 [Cannabis sativa]|uniref:Uncharacterized protein n=1 Tax=Cannabis sativa TaxID=3483 RepID=A0A7J6H7U4_CANSA|nr:hypothetical protein G4B88_015540 [Cannabis sativa]